MELTHFESWIVDMPLEEPYSTATEHVDVARNVILLLETNAGHVGFGAAAPEPRITGETAEETLELLQSHLPALARGADPLRRGALLHRLRPDLRPKPSALAAVDIALHDLLGKICGQPTWRLLGGYRASIPTSVTIGILGVRDTVERAVFWCNRGFHCLKIKGGKSLDDDVERTIKVREAVGPEVEIRFDANQGYDVTQAREFVRRTQQVQISIFEQPTSGDRPADLGKVSREVPVPVMADESLMGLRDAFRLARQDLVDMVNVKLMKVGGIAEAVQVNAVAKAAGYEVMVGCMDEMELSIAAGLHFALAHANVEFADLDGHLGLRNDPSHGTLRLEDGVLHPSPEPGFGVHLRA